MFCKNCGNEINDNAAVCLTCGAAKGTGKGFCANCGNAINENAAVCLNCGANISNKGGSGQVGDKQKVVAGLLAIFLGHLGIHWFYLGFKEKAIINIVLTVVSAILCFIGIGILAFIGVWVYNIVVAVQIFTGKQKDANGNDLC